MPNKAVAAGGGSGIAGALVTVALALWGHNVSPEVAAALTTVVGAVIAAVSTYLTPHNG